jgi:hypothetical protein
MPDADTRGLRSADEERLLSLIGRAVALQWRLLPEEMRAVILNQAETLSYRSTASTIREQLRTFLEVYSTRSGEQNRR